MQVQQHFIEVVTYLANTATKIPINVGRPLQYHFLFSLSSFSSFFSPLYIYINSTTLFYFHHNLIIFNFEFWDKKGILEILWVFMKFHLSLINYFSVISFFLVGASLLSLFTSSFKGCLCVTSNCSNSF